MIAESKLTMSLYEKEIANKRLRNGLLGLHRATKDYNEAEMLYRAVTYTEKKLVKFYYIVSPMFKNIFTM